MAELNSKTWLAVSNLIFRVNETTSYDEFNQVFYALLKPLIPYSKALSYKIKTDPDGSLRRTDPYCIVPEGEPELITKPILDGTIKGSADSFLRAPWSSAFRQSDIMSATQRAEDSVYKTLWEPQGLYYGLHFALVYHNQPVSTLVLYRTKHDPDFSEAELDIANVLKNHIALKLHSLLCSETVRYSPRSVREGKSRKGMFTPREEEILSCINFGKTTDEICRELYIEESTLRKHLHNIYRKTGTKNRTQLVLWLR